MHEEKIIMAKVIRELAGFLEWCHQQEGSPEYNKKVVMILNSLYYT